MRALSDGDIAELRSRTLSLVTEVGLRVDHQRVQRLPLSAGCTLAPDGRVRFPASLVADSVALQESRRVEERVAVELQTTVPQPPVWAGATTPALDDVLSRARAELG